jgi:T5SS/PEP-CTERM-associated repeat protein
MKTKFPSQIASWKNAILLAITAFALSASPRSRADAALCGCTRSWDNLGAGDWFDPSNWTPYHDFVPGCGEQPVCPIDNGTTEANINNGGEARIAQINSTPPPTAHACETFIGKDSAQSGKLSVVGPGTLDQCNDMFVGYYGKGTLSITNGGSVSTLAGASIAAATGSNGTATVDGTNSTWTLSGGSGVELRVGGIVNGGGGTGLLTVTNSGTIIAPSVHVYGSGTLTGNGAVTTTNGTTTMGGTLTPRAGTLTINGTLTFSSGATMECNVVPASADNVNVSGVASLAGKISVTMTGTTFTAGTTYTLLHSDGGLGNTQFQFVSIKTGTGDCFTPLITYDANNVKLYLSPCSN